MKRPVVPRASSIFAITLIVACTPEDDGSNPFGATLTYGGSFSTTLTDTGDTGDGDPGDGDGDPTGDGDGAPTGDGDGDPTGDGDGEADCPSNGPYQGGWDTGCCQDAVVPTGWFPGGIGPNSVLPDWTFTDQFGDAVRIYDFCHEAIYFEYVAFW